MQLDAANANPRCLVRAIRPLTLLWSNNGDKVLLGGLQTFLPGEPAGWLGNILLGLAR